MKIAKVVTVVIFGSVSGDTKRSWSLSEGSVSAWVLSMVLSDTYGNSLGPSVAKTDTFNGHILVMHSCPMWLHTEASFAVV